jgi:hypothetical protein
MKDRFSSDSKGYATFRPGYPKELVDFVLAHTAARDRAWDCGTGNGQLAAMLAPHFKRVDATDISTHQLSQATALPNIHYSPQPAEKTDFPDGAFDLITVAQAIHWFDFERFYAEVKRVAKAHSMIAVIGYPLFSINSQVDQVIHWLYYEILYDHWDKERRYLDEDYKTIPFPFTEIPAPRFESKYDWNFDQLIGYLNTWSAVKNYIKANGSNPLEIIAKDLQSAWGNETTHPAKFPMIVRLGKIPT